MRPAEDGSIRLDATTSPMDTAVQKAREELAGNGRTYTTEEILTLLREKQQRTG
jgi:hypothetical protein